MSTITHTTIKVDGKDNEYDMKFGGAVIGRATKGKYDVTADGKTKSVNGFKFTPSADFTKVGSVNGATMKDLKAGLEAAVTAAGIEAPKKAEPLPATAEGDAGLTVPVTSTAALAGTDGDIDI